MTSYRRDASQDDPVALNSTEAHRLLDDLCVRLGFCLPPEEREKLESNPPSNVESFTRAILAAEGLSAEFTEHRIYRAVQNMVAAAFNRTDANERATTNR